MQGGLLNTTAACSLWQYSLVPTDQRCGSSADTHWQVGANCNSTGKSTNSRQTSTPGALHTTYSPDEARACQRLQESKDMEISAQGMAVGRVWGAWGDIRIREKQDHIMEKMGGKGWRLDTLQKDGKGRDRICARAVQKLVRNQRINSLKQLETRTLVLIVLLKKLSLIGSHLEERTIMFNVFVQGKIYLLQCIKKLLDKACKHNYSQMQS